ncbi:hypothetical protein [Leuconostoc citreum]|uniref:hypothetical protein n=1 Tax=Leuconostoc citreum TaxID=33964 RepID=UPI0011BAEDF1|nr:hypothetical protein [Leuconostoc citreum]QEA37023.1 hypothetical protein FGL87_06745 [Leuconostoc citreum]
MSQEKYIYMQPINDFDSDREVYSASSANTSMGGIALSEDKIAELADSINTFWGSFQKRMSGFEITEIELSIEISAKTNMFIISTNGNAGFKIKLRPDNL